MLARQVAHKYWTRELPVTAGGGLTFTDFREIMSKNKILKGTASASMVVNAAAVFASINFCNAFLPKPWLAITFTLNVVPEKKPWPASFK